ncbi:unnamed protein product [marine sediment metagenome]|uniref:site-specific DNA-methyltransferase (cytosine-N(4)-specific) n=2 Tax=marine sediment metagenome TaxID=412755 RepID=X1L7X2_9ZZZZ
MEINKIYKGDALTILKTFPDEFVNCVITSPPYWALRDYGIEGQAWDGDEKCEHAWNLKTTQTGQTHWNQGGKVIPQAERTIHNGSKRDLGFCSKCGAWYGTLGLEPTFDLYIKHLCDIFDEVKRVLKKSGTCWVNMGDTYGGGGQGGADYGGIVKEFLGEKPAPTFKEIMELIPKEKRIIIKF